MDEQQQTHAYPLVSKSTRLSNPWLRSVPQKEQVILLYCQLYQSHSVLSIAEVQEDILLADKLHYYSPRKKIIKQITLRSNNRGKVNDFCKPPVFTRPCSSLRKLGFLQAELMGTLYPYFNPSFLKDL